MYNAHYSGRLVFRTFFKSTIIDYAFAKAAFRLIDIDFFAMATVVSEIPSLDMLAGTKSILSKRTNAVVEGEQLTPQDCAYAFIFRKCSFICENGPANPLTTALSAIG